MPMQYENAERLHSDDFADFAHWHHEGIGQLAGAPDGGMRLHCVGSKQGGQGCMAFFRGDLPDHIAVEYDLVIRSHGGLVINYVALRGIHGEDLIDDRDTLPPRTGIMADYYSATKGLQSYHVSISRFNDAGVHTDTSNARRNPGCLLISQGIDLCTEINRTFHIRVVKTLGHFQLWVDGIYCLGFFDRDTSAAPIPDTGKFGFRLIGSDVMADVASFRVHAIEPDEKIWQPWE